ncbi:Serine/threonine-protein kinase GIN4, partial [Symbiodinium microadriaticum]
VSAADQNSDKAGSPVHSTWSDPEEEQVVGPTPSQASVVEIRDVRVGVLEMASHGLGGHEGWCCIWSPLKYAQPDRVKFEEDGHDISEGVLKGRLLLPPWNPQRFRFWKVHMLAARSGGQVELYLDFMTGGTVAVKHLPHSRLRDSPQAYHEAWPGEVENPWKEIEIMLRFGFPGPDQLPGVARSFGAFCTARGDGMLVSEYLPGGDLFDIAAKLDEPGYKRELQVVPIIMSLIQGVRALHARGVAHGDISLENALLKSGSQVVLVDFAMAVTENLDAATGRRGKPSYMAPEMFTQRTYDARAADVFACGVCAYALAMGSYPWVSTRPGACLAFVFAQRFGLQALMQRRRLAATPRRPRTPIGECMSPAFRQNLVHMMAMDAARRPKLHEYVSYEVLQKGWASTD